MSTPTRVLSSDELLTTTRSVRKRLDSTRPVERELLEECVPKTVPEGTTRLLRPANMRSDVPHESALHWERLVR